MSGLYLRIPVPLCFLFMTCHVDLLTTSSHIEHLIWCGLVDGGVNLWRSNLGWLSLWCLLKFLLLTSKPQIRQAIIFAMKDDNDIGLIS